MEPKQRNALLLAAVGVLVIASVEPLRSALADSQPLLRAGVSFLAPVGLVLLAFGIYRYRTKDKKS